MLGAILFFVTRDLNVRIELGKQLFLDSAYSNYAKMYIYQLFPIMPTTSHLIENWPSLNDIPSSTLPGQQSFVSDMDSASVACEVEQSCVCPNRRRKCLSNSGVHVEILHISPSFSSRTVGPIYFCLQIYLACDFAQRLP